MNVNDLFPSRFLKAHDLAGKPYTLTIRAVSLEEVGHGAERESKLAIAFEKATKMMLLNRTNAMIIASLYGPETDGWVGKAVTVVSARVKAFGAWHDALRIKEQIPARNVTPERMTEAMQEQPPIDDENDLLDVDEGAAIDGDVLFTPTNNGHAKSPDDATIPQVKRCNQLGIRFYGTEGWNEQAPKVAHETSKGAVKRVEDLKVVEIEVVMRELERMIAHRAAELQATAK